MYNISRIPKDTTKYGEMAERSKAAVLKTVEVNSLLGFESLSLRHKRIVRTPITYWSSYFSFYKNVLGFLLDVI